MPKITEIMAKRMSFSVEVFPPKPDRPLDPVLDTLDELYNLQPDFISCTYGAGGSNVGRNMEICGAIQNSGKTITVAHFTCVGHTRQDVKEQLLCYREIGIDHFLALRGDLPAGWEGTRGDFDHANELIGYIRDQFGDQFTIAMAGAPEKHISADSFTEDIAHLRIKQDAGADYIMTQLCFDVEGFKRWMDMVRRAGVRIPIDVGIMPVLNKESIIRMALSVNGCSIPQRLAEIISRYYNEPEGFKQAGIEYTVRQIEQYMCEGVDGLHIYSLNKHEDVAAIVNMSGIRTNGHNRE